MKRKTIKQRPAQSATNKLSEPAIKRFSDHVSELRKRAFFVAVVFIIASSLAYNYHDFFVSLIMRPLAGEKLIYLTPGGGFNFIFQVSLYAGLLVAAPVLIYQLYGFIKPALPDRAKRSAFKVVSIAFFLMICGVCYGYFTAIPSALNFLSTFAGSDITPNLTADSYLNFFLAYIAGLGVLFELPLLLLFFHWIKPMTPKGLLKSERFIIIFAFIVAAIVTPTPDVFNQSMIAIPLIAIYQGGVIAVLLAIRRERKRPILKVSHNEPKLAQREEEVIPALRPVLEPVPVYTPQPPVKQQTVTAQPTRRSLDGFGPVRQKVAIPPRPVRPTTPTRPMPEAKPPYPRGRLSIDGFIS